MLTLSIQYPDEGGNPLLVQFFNINELQMFYIVVHCVFNHSMQFIQIYYRNHQHLFHPYIILGIILILT